MNFEEAGRRYAELEARRQSGSLSRQQFEAELARLQVQHTDGSWWALDGSGTWLRWDGTRWAAPDGSTGSSVASDSAPVGSAGETATRRSASSSGSLLGKGQAFWNKVSIFGGLVAGAGYYYYSSLRADREGGVDWQSAALIVLMPILLTIFRKPVDAILSPLNGIKRRIPRLILVGAGLITPYACAYYLYNNSSLLAALPRELVTALYGGSGLIQYEYMRTTLVVGTLLSYAILRMPPTARRGGSR